jgi:alginate O-acetyltransferase complex protein AlgI
MLFQTQFYLFAFLPVTAAAYYAVARFPLARAGILSAASVIFYGWIDLRLAIVPLTQISLTWLLVRIHDRLGHRAWLGAAIVLNLLSLAAFKYFDFLAQTLEGLTGFPLPRANIVFSFDIPLLAVSFFSFQLISYVIDRSRGQAPLYPLPTLLLFVMFYPHLVAGPIVRHNELIPQFAADPLRPGLWFRIGCGLTIFAIGLGKKVLLADPLASLTDPLYYAAAHSRALDIGEAWTALLGFSFRLFLDFSAYTEMAIGSALIFGLVLPENFRRPYLAVDIRDFWRRWHISLSSFLRDYLYIPLGGSRNGPARYVYATVVTMGLCGLWHGAGWTYVAWGLWHAAGLCICRAWVALKIPLPTIAAWLLTMLFVGAGWVLFRAADFASATSILGSLVGANGFHGTLHGAKLLALAALACTLIPSAHEIKDRLQSPLPAHAIAAALLTLYCILLVGDGVPVEFIYFHF